MRVSVRYDERRHGLIFPRTMTYAVWIIEFSDEEKAIIQQRKLDTYTIDGFVTDFLVIPNLSPDRWWHKLPWIGQHLPHRYGNVTLREALLHRTFIYRVHQVAWLNEYEPKLREALRKIQAWIHANKSVRRSTAFDL